MSSYKALILTFLLSLSLMASSDKRVNINEDLFILYALEFEQKGNIKESKKLYLELFKATNKYEYLVRFLRNAIALRSYQEVINYAQDHLDKDQKDYETTLRIYTIALLNNKQANLAETYAKQLLKAYPKALNHEVMANVYFVKEQYEEALEHFESAYSISKNAQTLLNVVNVQYAYLNQKEQAVAYLETHVRLYGCELSICNRLLVIYQEQNNITGAIEILKKSYFDFKEKNNYHSMSKIYKLLINYLEKKDINLAIEFLEEEQNDNARLLTLYRRAGSYDKALSLANKLYSEDGNVDMLAQIAILEFESAQNKQNVLQSVIKKFEDALIILDNHVYQNYLGYLLIDYDLDIKRGLDLVNKALEKAPNNVAYIDSLAWGEYKLGNCKEAYKQMKRVVDEVGDSDEEIKHHWQKIKKCK